MKKTTQIATMAIIVAAAMVAAIIAYPLILSASATSASMAPSATPSAQARTSHWSPQTNPNFDFGSNPMNSWAGPMRTGPGYSQSRANFTVGQTITITSTQGMFRAIGSKVNGTASGTLTFSVSGKLARGYVLSITGGSIEVAGTMYTISSGSAQMGPFAASIAGQGVTTAGTFLLSAQAHGSFAGPSTAFVSLDLSAGSTEYAVALTGAIQG